VGGVEVHLKGKLFTPGFPVLRNPIFSQQPIHPQGGVEDGISGCAGQKCPLFGHTAGAGTADATCCTAATMLPAALTILCARFWPSGLLAPSVGPSEPTTLRAIHVNAPLTTAQAGQLGLQARLKRLGFLFVQIGSCFHKEFVALAARAEDEILRFLRLLGVKAAHASPFPLRRHTGHSPDTRRTLAVDNFRPPATLLGGESRRVAGESPESYRA
jgi:hypothetical protein